MIAFAASCSGPLRAGLPSSGASAVAVVSPTARGSVATPPSLPATATVEATATLEPCRADATFLEDLTIPDGSIVGPGEEIDKRWAVENSGTCDWGPGYALVRLSSDELSGPAQIDLYP
ncbi:MAG: NBR1-Ig-like domain-containing protein, partial [Anaerolineales bacterium]